VTVSGVDVTKDKPSTLGWKAASLVQSVPACNSHTHPACKDAITSAPEHLTPLWKTDVEIDEENLIQSDPICNSEGCT
jgi:hypothetical protein